MNIAILLFNEIEVLDFAGPFEVFSIAAGLLPPGRLQNFTVARDELLVRTIGGLRVLADHLLAGSPAADVLVVPGGSGPRGTGFLYASERALNRGDHPIVVDMHRATRVARDRYRIAPDARRFEEWETPYALHCCRRRLRLSRTTANSPEASSIPVTGGMFLGLDTRGRRPV